MHVMSHCTICIELRAAIVASLGGMLGECQHACCDTLSCVSTEEKAWTDAGWETRVLTLEDAKRSPEFKNVNRRIDRIPRGGNAEYERLCYLRYLAMNAVGGGWMSDMDTVPTRLSPDIGLPNAGRFTVYAACLHRF